MKKHQKNPTVIQSAPASASASTSTSTALIAVAAPARRRGMIATMVRLVAAVVLLPVRLPVLALVAVARGTARLCAGIGRALATAGGGLLRIPVLLVRILLMPFVGLARGLAWVGSRVGRGVLALLLLPVKLVVGIARLVAWLVRGVARAILFILRIPFVALRLLARGIVGAARGTAFLVGAVTVPVFALAWGAVRYTAAGVWATARGIALALAFVGRLAGRGIAAILLGILVTFRDLVVGILVCIRGTARALLWIAALAFRALILLAVASARGILASAVLLAGAARTVAMGLRELVRGSIALVRLAIRAGRQPARSLCAACATRDPQRSSFLPLATLGALGAFELLGSPGFPFATVGLLLLAAFASLALLPRPTTIGAVLLAWALAVTCGWRADRVSPESPVWIDAFIYIAALAALRSSYVAARDFVSDPTAVPRAADQERAHRRASRAIGIALAAQCIAFTFWSADAGVVDTALCGELLLVGAGVALAWVVRTGQYIRTAQFALSLGAVGALVVAIAAQLNAFAAGQVVTPASIGAGVLLLLVATALTVVVHARLIDSELGA